MGASKSDWPAGWLAGYLNSLRRLQRASPCNVPHKTPFCQPHRYARLLLIVYCNIPRVKILCVKKRDMNMTKRKVIRKTQRVHETASLGATVRVACLTRFPSRLLIHLHTERACALARFLAYYSVAYSAAYSVAYSVATRSLTRSLTHSLPCSLTRPVTCLLAHTIVRSPTSSLLFACVHTGSPTCCLA